MATEDAKPITVKKLPLILNRKIIIKKGIKPLGKNIKVVKSLQNSFQEDVIYTSKEGDFMSGEARSMTIVNRLNILTKACKTIARCQSHTGQLYEKTSEEITKLIGQNNYDLLFSSLCSIISQELKIRSLYSLLTVPKTTNATACQTEFSELSLIVNKNCVETVSQTQETCLSGFVKKTNKRRTRRQNLAPQVVTDAPKEVKKPRRIVISPDKFADFTEEVVKKESTPESNLPELGSVFDEDSDSNNSMGRFSSLSIKTTSDLMDNPLNIISNVDRHTRDINNESKPFNVVEPYRICNLNSPESPGVEQLPFNLKEMLRHVPPEQRMKLLLRQGLTDWKYCLTIDQEGHLPIHVAVLTSDVDLLRRQCLVLKMRGSTVDLLADGMTPLRMALFQENPELTSVLLNAGADPFDPDDEDRTPFHIAADMNTEHLPVLLNYCQMNARKLLHENEELWKPSFENKTDEELMPILMMHINKQYDNQGYTPLMLASKSGRYNNVLALVESCRATVNMCTPNSGNTALYLAVSEACMDAAERGNKTKIVDHYKRTIEILVENGADPNINNFAGSSVNDLLAEFSIAELSMLIANKLTSVRYFDNALPNGSKGSDFMLFKDDKGEVNIKEVKEKKPTTPPAKIPPKNLKTSPVILENITIKSPVVGASPNLLKPIKLGPLTPLPKKQDNPPQFTPIVQKFKLNKPIIMSEIGDKRKLEIVSPNVIKRIKKND
ncbi:uncharacterized protein LOC118280388 [Spodoptera frugiperda]|uniref:Uncharacterized protein LOC118280388 n=2 Tax=Spodoptera frugiperda TaxID=7108 RepID=A0A9R0E2Q2_SPOFR|nr:uncharacterized protein LOC118280388 [Spodoptera frugiperda]XP_050558132.1 uncharacterized protein LOC118280388 [Spodoptera frugiperda]XP_050558133.1 uncharacterized protein LOC118280388 [Spodoptera frugiperda]